MDNKRENVRNWMEMQVWVISVLIRGIWVEMQKCGESGCRCRKSRWKFKYSGRNATH